MNRLSALPGRVRFEVRRHRARRAGDNLAWSAQLRRWWWRFVRSHDGEICGKCGRPVSLSCPSYWLATDFLWDLIEGGPGGVRCIPCFVADADESCIHVWFLAVEGHALSRGPLRPYQCSTANPDMEQLIPTREHLDDEQDVPF